METSIKPVNNQGSDQLEVAPESGAQHGGIQSLSTGSAAPPFHSMPVVPLDPSSRSLFIGYKYGGLAEDCCCFASRPPKQHSGIWNELRDVRELGTLERSVAFTFKHWKIGEESYCLQIYLFIFYFIITHTVHNTSTNTYTTYTTNMDTCTTCNPNKTTYTTYNANMVTYTTYNAYNTNTYIHTYTIIKR